MFARSSVWAVQYHHDANPPAKSDSFLYKEFAAETIEEVLDALYSIHTSGQIRVSSVTRTGKIIWFPMD